MESFDIVMAHNLCLPLKLNIHESFELFARFSMKFHQQIWSLNKKWGRNSQCDVKFQVSFQESKNDEKKISRSEISVNCYKSFVLGSLTIPFFQYTRKDDVCKQAKVLITLWDSFQVLKTNKWFFNFAEKHPCRI